jgi:hypothetical protein
MRIYNFPSVAVSKKGAHLWIVPRQLPPEILFCNPLPAGLRSQPRVMHRQFASVVIMKSVEPSSLMARLRMDLRLPRRRERPKEGDGIVKPVNKYFPDDDEVVALVSTKHHRTVTAENDSD